MELGWLIQFIVKAQVLSTSLVQRPVINSFVYSTGAMAPILADKAIWWAGFATAMGNFLPPILHVSYVGVDGQVLYPNTPGDTPLSIAALGNGVRAGNRMQLNVCAYCNLITDLRGRAFVGAKRLSPLATSDVVGDELFIPGDLPWLQFVGQLNQQFVITSSAGGMVTAKPVVWSRLLSSRDLTVPPAVGGFIGSAHVNKTLGSWRHRRERVVR
jgi:hypothetical protein